MEAPSSSKTSVLTGVTWCWHPRRWHSSWNTMSVLIHKYVLLVSVTWWMWVCASGGLWMWWDPCWQISPGIPCNLVGTSTKVKRESFLCNIYVCPYHARVIPRHCDSHVRCCETFRSGAVLVTFTRLATWPHPQASYFSFLLTSGFRTELFRYTTVSNTSIDHEGLHPVNVTYFNGTGIAGIVCFIAVGYWLVVMLHVTKAFMYLNIALDVRHLRWI
jgi:hypothetical protein